MRPTSNLSATSNALHSLDATELFLSSYFWAPENRGVLIKSPVDLIVGTTRLFSLPLSNTHLLPRLSRKLGQDVFDPPNVKGWAGGTHWITTTTLLERWQVLQRALRGHEMSMHRHKMKTRGKESPMGQTKSSRILDLSMNQLQNVMLAIAPGEPIPNDEERGALVRHLVLDPVYQLK